MPYTPTNPICSVADVKSALRITDTSDDDRVGLAVDAASRLIEEELGRKFWVDSTTSTRWYKSETPFLLMTHDFADTTDLVIATYPFGPADGTNVVWTAADYQLEPLNGLSDAGTVWPYEQIRAVRSLLFPVYGGIAYPLPYIQALTSVTTKWGFGYTPSAVYQAAVIQSIATFKAVDVPFGATPFGADGVVRLQYALHPQARLLLKNYYKQEVLVG